ncbi:hypothetical protein VYP57_11440 [Streptococcus agalactiae]|uniref:hypothetical protein n=1 Tax=Streptococcus agalactiae TaxID=1311 RepID=UPI0039C75FA8
MANLYAQQKEWDKGKRKFKPWRPRDFKRKSPELVESFDFLDGETWERYEYQLDSGYRLSCIAKYIGVVRRCLDNVITDVRCNRQMEIALLTPSGELSQNYTCEWGDSINHVISSNELLYWLDRIDRETKYSS